MTTPLSVLGATVDYSNAANPVLQIPFNGVKTAGNWGTPPTSAGVQDLDQWLVAQMATLKVWNDLQTSEIRDVVVVESFKGVGSRNNIVDRPTITYTVTTYNKTPLIIQPDADDVA